MKKTLIITLFIGVCHLGLIAQDSYNVINTKGKVSKNGKTIRRGQKLKSSDKIKFATSQAMLLVSSQKFGRMVLSANPRKKNISETSYILKNLISKGRASARGNEILFNKVMIWSYFGKDKHLILGGEERIKVHKTSFPMNKQNFFFINYNFKGEEVNKKLRFDKDQFIINKERLFRINKQKISGEGITDFKLFYYKDGAPDFIGDIKLVFLDDDSQVKKVIEEMVKFLKSSKMSREEIEKSVDAYLSKYLGEPNKKEFKNWFKKNYE